MKKNEPNRSLFYLVFVTAIALSAWASTAVSDGKFASKDSIGRSLLQAKKGCPVDFEFQNYTVITSQCKGPEYPQKLCCSALKEFACQFVDQINDLSTDCAQTMFSYITLSGNYPPGLFASECKEGKEGLECPATAPTNAGASSKLHVPTSLLLLGNAFLVLLLIFQQA